MMGMVMAAAAFAQSAAGESFTVQEVKGRVEREVSAGNFAPVQAGDTLAAGAVLKTGVGSSLTLKSGDKVYKISGVNTGKKVAELVSGSGSGIQISGRAVQTNTDEVGRTTSRIGTASARAANSSEDADLAE
ncbi:hypothetical protein AGMMS50293_11630 [Spirochaetia bacterium]|nr:hypothetical protein AGMMS50293_11630 [Spirochaetia bacterium]